MGLYREKLLREEIFSENSKLSDNLDTTSASFPWGQKFSFPPIFSSFLSPPSLWAPNQLFPLAKPEGFGQGFKACSPLKGKRHRQWDGEGRVAALGRSTTKPLLTLEPDLFHTSPASSPTVPLKENSEWSGISFEEGALYAEVARISWAAVLKDFFFLLNSDAL